MRTLDHAVPAHHEATIGHILKCEQLRVACHAGAGGQSLWRAVISERSYAPQQQQRMGVQDPNTLPQQIYDRRATGRCGATKAQMLGDGAEKERVPRANGEALLTDGIVQGKVVADGMRENAFGSAVVEWLELTDKDALRQSRSIRKARPIPERKHEMGACVLRENGCEKEPEGRMVEPMRILHEKHQGTFRRNAHQEIRDRLADASRDQFRVEIRSVDRSGRLLSRESSQSLQ
jgi:hypothetical protein